MSEDEGNAMEEITPAKGACGEPDAPKKRGRPAGAKNKPKEHVPPPDVYSALQERIAYLEEFAKKKTPAKPPKKTIQLSGSPASTARQLCERLQIPMAPERAGGRQPTAPRVRPTASPADAFLDNMHRAREERRHKREEFYASFLPSSR